MAIGVTVNQCRRKLARGVS